MQRLFAAVIAVACVLGSTPGFARGGFAQGAGFARGLGRCIMRSRGRKKRAAGGLRAARRMQGPQARNVIVQQQTTSSVLR